MVAFVCTVAIIFDLHFAHFYCRCLSVFAVLCMSPFSFHTGFFLIGAWYCPTFPRIEYPDDVSVYYPGNFDRTRVEGAFIVDSFEYMKTGKNGKIVYYMAGMLDFCSKEQDVHLWL